jgi:microcystin-dependent protein
MKKFVLPVLPLALAGALASGDARATCSSEPMIASICITAANFCPRGYMDAWGQVLPIAQNTALFSLVGTTYGGNGQTTFALPDLRGRFPRGVGSGPGLSPVVEGEMSGQESITLTVGQMPAHTHAVALNASSAPATTTSPAGALPARTPTATKYAQAAPDTALAANAAQAGIAGGSQPVSVQNPYLGLRYCIAVEGIFPSRP